MILEGIININKPAGMSSHDLVNMVRRLTGVKRIGHTGTLDPQATGVLPVCIGTASRITEYLDLDMKTYLCSMYLGVTSDTQDIWGKDVHDERSRLKIAFSGGKKPFDEQDIVNTLKSLSGVTEQVPPKYSAVWVNGRRLYDYARNGQEVEIPKRTIYIDSVEVIDIDMNELKVTFRVTCSKGTYIRSICADVGEKLGCGAAMCELTREASGYFNLGNAVSFEFLKQLCERRERALEKLGRKNKHPRGRMNDADILKGGVRVLAKLYGVEETLDAALEGEFDEIDSVVNKIIIYPDEPLKSFGRAKICTGDLADWFVGGGHIAMKEVEVLEKPRYQNEDFPLPIREEFRHAYRLYSPDMIFLGVAFYNFKYKKLVADKVFFHRDNRDIIR